MRICLIADATSIHTLRWAEYFVGQGDEVHIITYEPSSSSIEGVKLYVVGSRFKNLYFAFPFRHIKIMRIVKKINPDIVHAHFITKFGFHGALLGFHPFVISAWGSDVLVIPKTSKLLWHFTNFSLKRADMIHAVSEYMAEEIESSFDLPISNIKIVPFGIDPKQFNPNVDTSEIRTLLGWDIDPIVVSSRNFEPIYNIECLINAIPIVIKKVPNAKFMLLGKGTLRNRLQEMVKELGISNSVKIIGHVPHSELQKYLSCAKIYVSTSLSDSLGVSNLEAMACGLPVILTDLPINKELIKKGLDIELFPVGNSQILAEKIVTSIQRDNFIKNKRNYDAISSQYDWEKNMEEMKYVYLDLLSTRSKNM